MSWAAAHDSHVRAWLRSDPESTAVWERYRSGGYEDSSLLRAMVPRADVTAGDVRAAYWSAFLYQRLHADVMIQALQAAGFARRPPGAILVVDVGCGAGTTGIAVAELLEILDASDPILYVGCDHNPTMRSLCTDVLGHPEVLPRGSHVACLPTLTRAVETAAALVPRTGCTLATFSYFFRQGPVTRLVAQDVARELGPLVRARAPLRAVVTDATGKSHSDSYPDFLSEAGRRYGVEERGPGPIQYRLRYPYLYRREGTFQFRNPKDPTAAYHFLRLSPRTP